MCSIFGIVGKYDSKRANRASSLLSHRGENKEIRILENNLYLYYNRLAITNINQDTKIAKFDDTIILFNGEIYNYQELCKRDKSLEISEARAIYQSFKEFDIDFIKELRGMFAIAIITPKRVILARDLFGKKPLYYSIDNEKLILSSELRAIKGYQNSVRFDRKVLSELLFFQTLIPPNSFYKDIYQLAPSEVLIYDISNKSKKSHFPYSPIFKGKKESRKEVAVREIETRLIEATSLRVPKEVKWGCLLSGGLDSSLITALTSKYVGEVDTFSIGYDGYQKYDERAYARVVAKHIKSNHYEFEMGKDEFLTSLNEVIEHLDEPILDPATIPLWYMMGQIKAMGYKAILTGDGSDELFMGYRLYREYFDVEKAKELRYKNWLRNYFRANFSMNKEWERYKRVFSDTLLFRSMAELFTDLQLNRLLKLNVADDNSLKAINPIRERFINSGGIDERDWYSYCDINTLLSELFLKKLDRVSMAHTIEARSPFLDKELVEYIFSLDASLRLDDNIKALLKDVAKAYLPNEILERKKKGFSYPFIEWLRESGELKKIDEAQKRFNIFQDEALNELLKRANRQSRFKHHIWAIYIVSRWILKEFN